MPQKSTASCTSSAVDPVFVVGLAFMRCRALIILRLLLPDFKWHDLPCAKPRSHLKFEKPMAWGDLASPSLASPATIKFVQTAAEKAAPLSVSFQACHAAAAELHAFTSVSSDVGLFHGRQESSSKKVTHQLAWQAGIFKWSAICRLCSCICKTC